MPGKVARFSVRHRDKINYDAVIIGGGHNGLTCAAYLAMAGLKVIVLERRPVVGGAAVTEEFHPGFRNSVAAYTVSLLNPKVIADLRLAEHGLRIVERQIANFLPLDDGHYLKVGGGRTREEVAKFSDARRGPARGLSGAARGDRRRAARAGAGNAAERRRGPSVRGDLRADQERAHREPAAPSRARPAARAARSLHEFGRRLSRSLVRERADQGRVRLRRDRRQLCEPVFAGLGLCAAASLLRRGERQEGRVGPRHRRHGRDHAGDGEVGRIARRGDPCRCRGARGDRREGPRRRRGDRRAARRSAHAP